jgi:peptide deformylase
MIFPILKITDEDRTPLVALRQSCIDVTEFNRELQEIVEGMIQTLLRSNGVGLSAPQIGRNLNLFVMRAHPDPPDRRQVRVIINPKTIAEVGEDVSTPNEKLEGCLSIPGVLGLVTRRHEVDFVYWDENGQRHRDSLGGMDARIYQHEGDHLCGVLLVDKAEAFYPTGHHFAEAHRTQTAAGAI